MHSGFSSRIVAEKSRVKIDGFVSQALIVVKPFSFSSSNKSSTSTSEKSAYIVQ